MCLAFALAAIGAIFDMHTRLDDGTCPTMTKPLARRRFSFFYGEMREHKHIFACAATNTATRALRNR